MSTLQENINALFTQAKARRKSLPPPPKGSFRARSDRFCLYGRPEFILLARACAEARGISFSTYIRRPLAVQVAKDSDYTLQQVLTWLPQVKRYADRGGARGMNNSDHDNGEGIEGFCPHPGCDGQHLALD